MNKSIHKDCSEDFIVWDMLCAYILPAFIIYDTWKEEYINLGRVYKY